MLKKNIFNFSLVVIGITLFFVGAEAARADANLNVEFQNNPLFVQAAFAPGESVTRWFKVSNLTSGPQPVKIKVANFSDADNLGSLLDVEVISAGESAVVYHSSLKNMYDAGEITLDSSFPAGATRQYDVSVSMSPDAGNYFQGKTLSFDFQVGMEVSGNGGGGGGGGGGPAPGQAGNVNQGDNLPSSGGQVAGENITMPQLPAGGGKDSPAKNIFSFETAAQKGRSGQVLGEDVGATPPSEANYRNVRTPCRNKPWWLWGYAVYLMLLTGIVFGNKKWKKSFWSYINVALLLGVIAWWWLEPCGRLDWLWPSAAVILSAIGQFLLLKNNDIKSDPPKAV